MPGSLSHIIVFFQLNKKPSRESRSEATHGKATNFQFVQKLFVCSLSVICPLLPEPISCSALTPVLPLPQGLQDPERQPLVSPQQCKGQAEPLLAAAGHFSTPSLLPQDRYQGYLEQRSSSPRTLDL